MNKTNRRNRVEQAAATSSAISDSLIPSASKLKDDLTLQIYPLIRQRGLTQAEAGQILRIRQPHVSVLLRGRSGAFSVERLMQFLIALGQDVQVIVRSTRKRQGELSVVVR
jgi:predicted XRE-type DNA-binding protein